MGLLIKPFETSVAKVQITCLKDAHWCTKKKSCLREFGFVMWFGTSFKFAMHFSNVRSGAHIRLDVFICKFIDVMKSIKVELHLFYFHLFCKYDDFDFNEFIVICEHHNE